MSSPDFQFLINVSTLERQQITCLLQNVNRIRHFTSFVQGKAHVYNMIFRHQLFDSEMLPQVHCYLYPSSFCAMAVVAEVPSPSTSDAPFRYTRMKGKKKKFSSIVFVLVSFLLPENTRFGNCITPENWLQGCFVEQAMDHLRILA